MTGIRRMHRRRNRELATESNSLATLSGTKVNPRAYAARADMVMSRGFSLRLLFGAMTILCVAAAIARLAPILGLLFGVIGVPALVRAVVLIKRRGEVGMHVIFEDRAFVTIQSVGVAFIVAMVAAGAFLCTFAAVGLVALAVKSQVALYAASGMGAMPMVVVWCWAFRRFWPPKVMQL